MKNVFHILIFVFLGQSLFAQETDSLKKNELGINVFTVLDVAVFKNEHQVFSNFGEINVPKIYQSVLTYRTLLNDKLAIRFGAGFFQKIKRDSFISAFNVSHSRNKITDFSMFFGYQKSFFIDSKLSIYSGFNCIYKNRRIINSTKDQFFGFLNEVIESKNTYKENTAGFGLPLGVQYYFTKRISISTEMNVELLYGQSSEKFENSNQSEPSFGNKIRLIDFNLNPPIGLFLNYRF